MAIVAEANLRVASHSVRGFGRSATWIWIAQGDGRLYYRFKDCLTFLSNDSLFRKSRLVNKLRMAQPLSYGKCEVTNRRGAVRYNLQE